MKLLLIADGRSPITLRWLKAIQPLGYEIHLVSTFPCPPIEQVRLAAVLPVAFASLAGSQVDRAAHAENKTRRKLANWRPLLQKVRYVLGPLTLSFFKRQFEEIVLQIKPDIVHALRIPFEGMLAAALPQGIPLLLSTWGNDLTLHAHGSLLMKWLTRKALGRADGLFSDTRRDIQLAKEWGLKFNRPAINIPGNGGLDLDEIQKIQKKQPVIADYIKEHFPVIINPRGFRPGSVHQDVFFQCLSEVMREFPDALVICTGMQGQPDALRQVKALRLEHNVQLLPYVSQPELWNLYRQSQVYVSLSSHDGTPNTLLEAMAFGCLPVCGDIESIREWITDKKNGLLVDPLDARAAAQALITACRDQDLRNKAAKKNQKIIRERANVQMNRMLIKAFYQYFSKEK
jgi:glycosyltransferase involved in cell wall biosynthesis